MQSIKLHKIKESLRSSVVGFKRYGQESLNNNRKSQQLCQLFFEHYLMLPASDYPLAGCSPAEPTSVSSDTLFLTLKRMGTKEINGKIIT
jgi:hypothetical protein